MDENNVNETPKNTVPQGSQNQNKHMTKCKACGADIAKSAKVCPSCGAKNKKPVYKRVWFWVLIVLIVIAFGSCGGSKTDSQAPGKTNTTDVSSNGGSSQESVTAENTSESESVPKEYKSALKKAESYSGGLHMSKAAIYAQLTSEYGEQFSAEAAQYAMDNINADWNANALAKAESYSSGMHMSKAAIYDQLTSEYGEQFTAEQAQYAIDNVDADWNANALAKAESYQDSMNMSPNAIYDQLVSEYGEHFTAEQAQYAIDNLSK